MTEQLYKIEQPTYQDFNQSMGVYQDGKFAGVLVPVPAPRTLAWALGEMLSHEKQAYCGCEDVWRRYAYGSFDSSMDKGKTWQSGGEAQIFWTEERESTSWSPCEAESPAIVPGSRNWLASLPDGTEVEHDRYGPRVKRGERVYKIEDGRETGSYMTIEYLGDSGWRLRTQPQAAPTVVRDGDISFNLSQAEPKTESTIELSHEEWIRKAYGMDEQAEPTLEQRTEEQKAATRKQYEDWCDMVEQKLERLERLMDTNYGPVKP